MRLNGPFAISNLTARKAIADAAYTVGTTDTTIYTSYAYTSITASRIFTLCAATAVPAGFRMLVKDASGSCASPGPTGTGIEIQIKPAGSDTVEGVAAATNFEVIRDARGSCLLESDGVSNWIIVAVVPHTRVERYWAVQTHTNAYRKPLTCSSVRVVAIGAGGSGASGNRQAANTAAGGGGGGAGGALTDALISAADLAATETIVVGATGGATGTRSSAGNGSAGAAGNPSSMTVGGSTVGVFAGGGSGAGAAGTSGNSTIALPGIGSEFGVDEPAFYNLGVLNTSGVGADGAGNTAAAAGYSPRFLAPGGGGGGGGTTTGALVAAAAGGAGARGIGSAGAGATGGTAGVGASAGSVTAPGAATAATTVAANAMFGGGGGGGGGAGRTIAGGAGGTGARPGGGGGGGGACSAIVGTLLNGAGGPGGDGAVFVTSYR